MTKDTENGEEQIGKDEQKIIDELVRLNIGMAATDPGNAKRGQHAKHHGCVTATFTLREDIPEHLRHGIFAESGSFDALIRFSNGKQKDDRKPDAHGMAIKLLGRSETEPARDFVLVDNEVFFLANMAEYLFVNRGVAKSQRSKVSKGLFIVSLLLRPRLAIRLVKFIWHKPASPLKSHYWSTTPYRLGEHQAVKYMARSLQAEGAGAKTGVNGETGCPTCWWANFGIALRRSSSAYMSRPTLPGSRSTTPRSTGRQKVRSSRSWRGSIFRRRRSIRNRRSPRISCSRPGTHERRTARSAPSTRPGRRSTRRWPDTGTNSTA